MVAALGLFLFLFFPVALVLEVLISKYAPVRAARWLALFPVGRTRRFRYLVPEGEEEALEVVSDPVLDRSLESALRVMRDVRVPVRVREVGESLLFRARARWVKDELEVSIRLWPVGVLSMPAISASLLIGALHQHGPDQVLGLLFAVIFLLIPLLGLSSGRRAAKRITLELLDLARPREGALPFEITRDGKRVPVGRRLRIPHF